MRPRSVSRAASRWLRSGAGARTPAARVLVRPRVARIFETARRRGRTFSRTVGSTGGTSTLFAATAATPSSAAPKVRSIHAGSPAVTLSDSNAALCFRDEVLRTGGGDPAPRGPHRGRRASRQTRSGRRKIPARLRPETTDRAAPSSPDIPPPRTSTATACRNTERGSRPPLHAHTASSLRQSRAARGAAGAVGVGVVQLFIPASEARTVLPRSRHPEAHAPRRSASSGRA